MKKVWITYSWKDNECGDVEYIAQELENEGLSVMMDRWNISAGERLWEQIDKFITDESESDAWIFVATQNSLTSEPCKEEFAYALQRALNERGSDFPFIGLFLGPVENSLVPTAVSSRLYVSLTDENWKERILSSINRVAPSIPRKKIEPYEFRVHRQKAGNKNFAIEMRPRAGVWAPFIAGIPMSEKHRVNPMIMAGPKGVPASSGMHVGGEEEVNGYWLMSGQAQANPTTSYFLWCEELPSEVIFGVNGGPPQFKKSLSDR